MNLPRDVVGRDIVNIAARRHRQIDCIHDMNRKAILENSDNGMHWEPQVLVDRNILQKPVF